MDKKETYKLAKFRLASDGNATFIELDGKSMGEGVQSVYFEKEGNSKFAKLELKINLNEFRFAPDGWFDEKEAQLTQEREKIPCPLVNN